MPNGAFEGETKGADVRRPSRLKRVGRGALEGLARGLDPEGAAIARAEAEQEEAIGRAERMRGEDIERFGRERAEDVERQSSQWERTHQLRVGGVAGEMLPLGEDVTDEYLKNLGITSREGQFAARAVRQGRIENEARMARQYGKFERSLQQQKEEFEHEQWLDQQKLDIQRSKITAGNLYDDPRMEHIMDKKLNVIRGVTRGTLDRSTADDMMNQFSLEEQALVRKMEAAQPKAAPEGGLPDEGAPIGAMMPRSEKLLPDVGKARQAVDAIINAVGQEQAAATIQALDVNPAEKTMMMSIVAERGPSAMEQLGQFAPQLGEPRISPPIPEPARTGQLGLTGLTSPEKQPVVR